MELKNIRVFVCVPGAGKSFLAKNDDRFVDMDWLKAKYKYNLPELSYEEMERSKGGHREVVNHNSIGYIEEKMRELLDKTDKVLFFAPNPDVVDMICKNHIPYCFIYFSHDCKEEIVRRLRQRGNSEEFIERMIGPFEEFYKSNVEDERPAFKIELKKGEYIADVMKKIFG